MSFLLYSGLYIFQNPFDKLNHMDINHSSQLASIHPCFLCLENSNPPCEAEPMSSWRIWKTVPCLLCHSITHRSWNYANQIHSPRQIPPQPHLVPRGSSEVLLAAASNTQQQRHQCLCLIQVAASALLCPSLPPPWYQGCGRILDFVIIA